MKSLYKKSLRKLTEANATKAQVVLVHVGLILLIVLAAALSIEYIQIELRKKYFFKLIEGYQAWGLFFFGSIFLYRGLAPLKETMKASKTARLFWFVLRPLLVTLNFLFGIFSPDRPAGYQRRSDQPKGLGYDFEQERNQADKIWWNSNSYYDNDPPD